MTELNTYFQVDRLNICLWSIQSLLLKSNHGVKVGITACNMQQGKVCMSGASVRQMAGERK